VPSRSVPIADRKAGTTMTGNLAGKVAALTGGS